LLGEASHPYLTGEIEAMKLAMQQLSHVNFNVGQHHVQGYATAHAWLTNDEGMLIMDKVLIEDMKNIVTSRNAERQVTARTSKGTAAIVALALEAQVKYGCLATLRTHGTVRITAGDAITPKILSIVRSMHAHVRVFTDVPVNAWAPANPDDAPKPVQIAPPEGKKVVRLMADYAPPVHHFAVAAKKLGGSVAEIRHSKFTSVAMTAIALVPNDAKLPNYVITPLGRMYTTRPGEADA
jgi:hypothetical protein